MICIVGIDICIIGIGGGSCDVTNFIIIVTITIIIFT